MATNRHVVSRPYRSELTHRQELELCLGPSHHGSAFGSRSELHQAWRRHRDRLMAAWAKHGKRPAGWWEFEAPFPRPHFEREQSTLYEANLLPESEAIALVAWWREQFERAWDTHFFFCDGPGAFSEGALARRKHYDWADIPRQLVRNWTAQRRRRKRTIGELAKASAAEPADARRRHGRAG
jgi:hypothetical protein